MATRDFRPWTEDEDRMLLDAVACYDEGQVNWLEVASRLEGRNNKDCRKRYAYSLAPSIKKGPWDEREDRALREGVQQYGIRWSEVSKLVGTRQADQCARRWHEALKPNISKDRWSLFEDEMLKNAVRAHGRRWTEIVDRYFPERTPIAARNRYTQLIRRTQELQREEQLQLQSDLQSYGEDQDIDTELESS